MIFCQDASHEERIIRVEGQLNVRLQAHSYSQSQLASVTRIGLLTLETER